MSLFHTLEVTLPCGHKMRTALKTEGAMPDSAAEKALFNGHAADVLSYWMKSRLAQHQCELVSDDNPHGTPREKTQ